MPRVRFAFFVVAAYVALWAFFRLDTLDWHSGATIATWCMTLVIQRAERRDTQAIHAKLDEILHTSKSARNKFTKIDDKEPEEIEEERAQMRKND